MPLLRFAAKLTKPFVLLAVAMMPFCGVLALAQPAQEGESRARLSELTAAIQTELLSHGERMLGHETYRWSTRLEKVSNCRAEISIKVTSNLGETTVRIETLNFSLSALEFHGTHPQKTGLELVCAGKEKCIYSTSTCSRKTKDGILIDCTTASQKQVDTFALQLDGDVAAASRLEGAFREAGNICRQPTSVIF